MENDEITLARCRKANEFAERLNAAIQESLSPRFEQRDFNGRGYGSGVWQTQIKTDPLTDVNEDEELELLLKDCVSKFAEIEASPASDGKSIRCFCENPANVVYRCTIDEPPRYFAKLLVGYFTEEEYSRPIKPPVYRIDSDKHGWVDIDELPKTPTAEQTY